MAYDIQWNGIISGTDTGDVVEGKLTASFTIIETALNELDTTKASATPVSTKYTPQTTAPAYQEGQMYYNDIDGTFRMQGPFSGIEVAAGHGEHIHVINNSGAVIEAGMAVRPDGISAGKVQVVKALADTFDHARVLGVAVVEIPDGVESAVATSGFVENIDTNGITLGTPIYLSDTVAGTYSAVAPDIRSQIGGVFVADAIAGRLFVRIVNNQNIPTVFGEIAGQTGSGLYAATSTAQDITDYATEDTVVTTVDKLLGKITLPNDGRYRVNFTANIGFISSISTRTISIELYDETGADIHYTYDKNIPRDATVDSLSFGYPLTDEATGRVHKMRIKSVPDMDVTFNSIVFDIESISIK